MRAAKNKRAPVELRAAWGLGRWFSYQHDYAYGILSLQRIRRSGLAHHLRPLIRGEVGFRRFGLPVPIRAEREALTVSHWNRRQRELRATPPNPSMRP